MKGVCLDQGIELGSGHMIWVFGFTMGRYLDGNQGSGSGVLDGNAHHSLLYARNDVERTVCQRSSIELARRVSSAFHILYVRCFTDPLAPVRDS